MGVNGNDHGFRALLVIVNGIQGRVRGTWRTVPGIPGGVKGLRPGFCALLPKVRGIS